MIKFTVVMALAASMLAAPGFGAKLPRKAPDFTFQMVDGTRQQLDQYKGKTIVLAFMYTTCPHCQKISQLLAQVQKEYEGKDVQILGAVFDQGAASRLQEFNKTNGLNFPVGSSDSKPVLDFLQFPSTEPYFVPILVFIDKNGMIRAQYFGDDKFLESPEVNVRGEIDKLVKGGASTTGVNTKKAPKS